MTVPVLALRGLTRRFGAIDVLSGIDLEVAPGARHWIHGANGAGKSTLLNLISGFDRPDRGEILFDGNMVESWPARRRADHGMTRNWQIPACFLGFTVAGQISAALAAKQGRRYWMSKSRDEAEQVASIAVRFGLQAMLDSFPADLGNAGRRRLDLALALMVPARLILLDEPSAGLNRGEARELFESLNLWIGDAALLLVEHDAEFAHALAEHAWSLRDGQLTPDEAASGSDRCDPG